MAKTYQDFEKVLCEKVDRSCADLFKATSKTQKIAALTTIKESVSILQEWYEIEEPIVGIDLSAIDDREDDYDEPTFPKSKKEEY